MTPRETAILKAGVLNFDTQTSLEGVTTFTLTGITTDIEAVADFMKQLRQNERIVLRAGPDVDGTEPAAGGGGVARAA